MCGRGGPRLCERSAWKGREDRALTECPNLAFASPCPADQRVAAERGERGLQLVPELPPRRDRASRCRRRCPGALRPLPPGRPLPCAQLPPRSQRNREPAPPHTPPVGTTAALLGPLLHWPGQLAARLPPGLRPFRAAPRPASNGARPLRSLRPPRILTPPLSRAKESRQSGPHPRPFGSLEPSPVFAIPGPVHGLLFGSLSPPATPHPSPGLAPCKFRRQGPCAPARPCQL